VHSRRLVLVAGLLAVVALAAGCSENNDKPKVTRAFCTAADKLDHELQRQSSKGLDIDKQIARVEELAAAAPAPIRPQAEIYLDAMRRVKSDPGFKRDDPKIRTAVDDVNRYASQGCNVYQRNGV
jgi:hypothetical protein